MDQEMKLENGDGNLNFEEDSGVLDNSDHFDHQPIPTLEERMREEKPSAPRPVTEKIRKWQEEQKKRLGKKGMFDIFSYYSVEINFAFRRGRGEENRGNEGPGEE